MAEYSKKCGPEAYDNYDNYTPYYNSSKRYRHHTITGKGVVERFYSKTTKKNRANSANAIYTNTELFKEC